MVGAAKRFVTIVRHHDDGGAGPFEDVDHLDSYLRAKTRIQIGERLVKKKQVRGGRKRSGHRHALLLPTGELMREAAPKLGEPHQLKHLRQTSLAVATSADSEFDVLRDGQMRKQSQILKDQADFSVLGGHIAFSGTGDIPTIKKDAPRIGHVQSGDDSKKGALSTAARTEQHAEPTLGDLKRDIGQHGMLVEGLVDLFEFEHLGTFKQVFTPDEHADEDRGDQDQSKRWNRGFRVHRLIGVLPDARCQSVVPGG